MRESGTEERLTESYGLTALSLFLSLSTKVEETQKSRDMGWVPPATRRIAIENDPSRVAEDAKEGHTAPVPDTVNGLNIVRGATRKLVDQGDMRPSTRAAGRGCGRDLTA